MDPSKEKEVEDEYLSSLMDLNVNSKPLINMLTMLAEDNLECAHVIVRVIEKHLAQVSPDVKLPILYLIDSIVKNVGSKYKQLFAQDIVNIFCGVFEKVNEKVREKMFNLRQTWNEVFPQTKLYALDVKVNVIDNNWPITAKVVPKSVHVNPNFIHKNETKAQEDLVKQMQAKERELLELKQRKIELELMVTKKKIAEQEKEIQGVLPSTARVDLKAVPTPLIPGIGIPPVVPNQAPGRRRIAPASSGLVSSMISRDPRLSKIPPAATTASHNHPLPPPLNSLPKVMANPPKLPRIPKFNNSSNNSSSTSNSKSSRDQDERERDPRKRRDKDRDESKSSSRDKSKSKSSSSSDRKKSGSSSDSPRKKSEEEKKLSKGSSHHKSSHSRSHSSKSPSKNGDTKPVDIDLRQLQSADGENSKLSKNKLLSDLLHDEDMKSSLKEITASNNEESQSEQLPKCDTDLRFVDAGKKKRPSSELAEEVEQVVKKNRTETDTLFGSEDVDLRSLNDQVPPPEKKPKLKEKSDFETVRAKLANASKIRQKTGGIKLLDELPHMAPQENGVGPSDFVKKLMQRNNENKEREASPITAANNEHSNSVEVALQKTPVQAASIVEEPEKKEEIADFSNMTTADLRKITAAPTNTRKDKRKESKWSQPTVQAPWVNQQGNRMNQNTIPLPHHFINPWETNPMVVAMQKQSQLPLVIPQSPAQPILNNKMRTLRLDGTRDHLLRFYGETAIIFNEVGEAHDIRFSTGQSKVIIDDVYSAVLEFNDSYKPIMIDGVVHQIKFGTPTRELYIDDNFYECYFNNQITQIIFADKIRRVRIDGNAPEVKIGNKRNDIVLGLINMMIDAEVMIPVFLDTTLQYFEYKGQIFTLQFADFFLSVVINNEPFKVEFGGLPKNFVLNGQKHFIRFTVLPDDVVPGQINMRGMRRTHLFKNCKSPPILNHVGDMYNNDGMDVTPHMMENDIRSQQPNNIGANLPGIGNDVQESSLPNLNINDLLQKLVATGIIGSNPPAPTSQMTNKPAPLEKKNPSPERNVEKDGSKTSRFAPQEERSKINPVNLTRPETIKKRQQAIVETLYSGIQCGSCGLRFPPEQTIKYSQHLDWHFRQNRRERDSKRRAHSRKWYYNQSDWIKYEEIEDLDEREKNFFETQQMEAMDQNEDSNLGRSNGNQENSANVSCPAGPDDVNRSCDMCHDQFEQFFNEDTEEWHLRSAIRVEDKLFHPICYEDYKASLTLDESGLASGNETLIPNTEEDVEMSDASVLVKEEKQQTEKKSEMTNDDDDDVIVLPSEEPIITEIPDEPETVEPAPEVESDKNLSIIDDDVMIQEPKIETQVVNDDDDDDYNMNSDETSQPNLVVKIKEEPKDDGYEDAINEEDPFVEVTSINEDFGLEDTRTHSPFQPALDENAIFDESSLIMSNASPLNSNDEGENSRPESLGSTAVVGGNKKLKIVLSSLAQNNLTNKNLNSNVMEQNDISNLDSVNKLDSNSVDFQKDGEQKDRPASEESELCFEVKPHLKDFKFEKNLVPVKKGFENSGLCSIM